MWHHIGGKMLLVWTTLKETENSIIKIVLLWILLLIRISCFGYVTKVINANVVIGQGMDNLSGGKIKRNMRSHGNSDTGYIVAMVTNTNKEAPDWL